MAELLSSGDPSQRILTLRGLRVMLDADLAELYGVTTKRFNEQVKRNLERFPPDFMFQLSADEKSEVVANCDHLGNLRYSPHLPFAFTEHGAIMAASVLKTPRAIEMSVFVVRAFVKLREFALASREFAGKLDELERKVASHDQAIAGLIHSLREMMSTDQASRPIGFTADVGRTGKKK